jgi:hypothetical protein
MARPSGVVGAPARSGASLTEFLHGPHGIQRRAASFAIVRSDAAWDGGPRVVDGPGIRDDRRTPSSRRASLSWLRSRAPTNEAAAVVDSNGSDSEKGWRSWRPVRALTHLRMRRAGCLFSIEVAGARGLPPAVEGRRLAVTVRKAETRDGAVQTMPCRVRDGGADFDETLFVRCSLYFTGGKGIGKPLRLEPRRFLVSVLAVDALAAAGRSVHHHHHLGTHAVDVSALVLESVERSSEGRRVRWFDRTVGLSGKAAGGELLLKLGFQLMEDAGLSLYTQTAGERDVVPPAGCRAWAHNRKSFSIISSASSTPKLSATTDDAVSPSMRAYTQLIDRLRIDERGDDVVSLKKHGEDAAAGSPAIPQTAQTKQPAGDDEAATDPGDTHSIPEFEVAEKGVETVKEVVHYQAHRDVLRELDSIAAQIVAIEALMTSGGAKTPKEAAEDQKQRLDSDEEMVTMDFLRKLKLDADKKLLKQQPVTPRSQSPSPRKVAGVPPVVPDLGPSLGPVVQTRDGGFLVSMNPFDMPLASRDEPPKLAMQVSRPFVLLGAVAATGFHVLQKMAEAAGSADEVRDRVAAFGGMDDLKGKAPAQVGFEGIAEAVIGGRRTEGGATSSAALSVQLVRRLAAAATAGRSERVTTGIWTAGDDPETLDEVLAFSLQKLEAMALDALAVQAEMADEDAPLEVGVVVEDSGVRGVFESLVPCDASSESDGGGSDGRVTLVAAVQLRDPSRRYEAVGAPMVVVVQSARLLGVASHSAGRFKVRSLNVGGVQVRSPTSGAGSSASWSAERQKLTAMQWMHAHGPDRPGKRTPTTLAAQARARVQQLPDVVWSLSSRVIAGMWLKTVRNPDVQIGAGSSTDHSCC